MIMMMMMMMMMMDDVESCRNRPSRAFKNLEFNPVPFQQAWNPWASIGQKLAIVLF